MSVVCKIIVYTSDVEFADRIRKIFNGDGYMLKVFDLFSDVIDALQRELYDVLIVETEFVNEMNGLLKIADNILLGIPIIVASGESGFRVENGNYSKFYFINKFAEEDDWKNVIWLAINENYVITSGGN